MKARILFLLFTFIALSCEESSVTEMNIDPPNNMEPLVINISIDPIEEPVAYNSDITVTWTIENATTATYDGESISLQGSKMYSGVTENIEFEIVASNENTFESELRTILVDEVLVRPMSYDIVFKDSREFFTTDGTLSQPVSRQTAQSMGIEDKIDITYLFRYHDEHPGFMDPVSRSIRNSGWPAYHEPWLENSVETVFYTLRISREEFEVAQNDESKIAEYFEIMENTPTVCETGNGFPHGTFVGESYSDTNLIRYSATAFENLETGKRGFIYIHHSQSQGWPYPIHNRDTRAIIIREN